MSTPEPVGEFDGVPQYAQARMELPDGRSALIVADTPPEIGGQDAEAEAGG